MPVRSRRVLLTIGIAALAAISLSACGGSSDEEASTANFCDAYESFSTVAADSPSALFTADLSRLVATAPTDDLRQAAETVRDGLGSVSEADIERLKNLSLDDPSGVAELETILTEVFTPEFEAAADQIDDYAGANCTTSPDN